MIRVVLSAAFVAGALLIGSCTTSGGAGGERRDNGECEGIAICNEAGRCEAVECLDSSQCNLGYTCDDAGTCIQGCGTDDDCLAGETCNANGTCQAYGCRSTTLDCGYGQRCDAGTGTCVVDALPHCDTCTSDYYSDSCQLTAPDAVCACFGEFQGSECIGGQYCLVDCDATASEPCPRGYQCAQAFSDVAQTYCLADCDFINGVTQ